MEIIVQTKFNLNDFVLVDGFGKCQVLGIRVHALKHISHNYEPDIQYLVSPQDESKVKMKDWGNGIVKPDYDWVFENRISLV
jgi:hypothetical protein